MYFSKMTILLLIFVVNFHFAAVSQAEEEDNEFGVTLGLTEYQTQELVLNKVKHRGMFPSLGLSYKMPNEISIHDIELRVFFNLLKSRFEEDDATFASNVVFNYKYSRKVKDLTQNISLFLGGVTGLDANISYFENWDESHFYWLTSYYLGLDGTLIYKKPDRSFFSFEIQIPLLALVSRPPKRFTNSEVNPGFSSIIDSMHDNLKLTSLHRHFDLKLDLAYTFQYSSKFKQTFSWRFKYVHNRMPYSKKVKILIHTFGVTFLF